MSKAITFNIINPSEYKRLIFEISYGFHSTPFGKCLIGLIDKGICHLSFVNNDEISIEPLKTQWPQAQLIQDLYNTENMIKKIFFTKDENNEFEVIVKGTEFQLKVWKTLVSIPEGEKVNYENIAHVIGNSKAVRAVGSACAQNSIAYLIPCHRVISKSGKMNHYRWGAERKADILAYETNLKKQSGSHISFDNTSSLVCQ